MKQTNLSEYESSGVECPTCGGTFKGKLGVRIHHKRTHGESIRGTVVECDWCGDEYREKDHRVKERDNLFCSRSCMGEWRSENFVGEDSPSFKGEVLNCENCGEEFTASPYQFTHESQNPTYCSTECRGQAFETRYAGKNNPRWEGGQFAYGPGWNRETSAKIRIRDQARCVDCGVSERETVKNGEGPLHVHHICGARQSTNPAVYNAERNLVTLCVTHHREWEKHTPGKPPIDNDTS